jgi:predicted phage terminase large subunit-like protein
MALTVDDLKKLPPNELRYLIWRKKWLNTAREKQLPPTTPWVELGALAGRGFGKTLMGAQWIADKAYTDANNFPRGVIAPTLNDVRHTCFEGPAGILSIMPPELVYDYNKTNLIITLVNRKDPDKPGSIIRGFSAEEPERLRGPQFADLWCFIAGTKVATPEGCRAIEALQPGDLVLTRKGPRRVVANAERQASVGRVLFANGAELVGTADHPVYTNVGWTRLDQLNVGEAVCALSAWSGEADAGTPTGAATTSARTKALSLNAPFGFTAKSGKPRTDRSPSGTTCTTLTTTGRTTTSKIWSACRRGRTAATTCWTALFPEKIGKRLLSAFWPAWTAEPSFAGNVSLRGQPARGANSAMPTSSAGLCGRARSAEEPSDRAPETSALSVASIWRPLGRQSVYCLKVEGEPEYFANGVLVHNCDELAAWTKDEDTFDMAMMGLRLGPHPQIMWTTTPKPKDLIRKLSAPKEGRVIVRGSTYDNRANLPKSFFEQLKQYEGTQLGRQELEGELIDAEEGGIIARSWLKLWPVEKPLPAFQWIIMSLDTAFTERTIDKKSHNADPTACTVWGVFWTEEGTPAVLLLDCWAEQYGLPDLMKRVKREMNVAYGDDGDTALIKPLIGPSKVATSGRKPDILLIEDKGSGISLRQMLDREGITSYPYNPGRADKLTRLHMVSHIFAQGKVWLPESERHRGRPKSWVEPLLAQLCAFTGSGSIKHDDYVDSTTQAVRLCMDKNLLAGTKPTKRYEEERPYKAPVVNPYGA